MTHGEPTYTYSPKSYTASMQELERLRERIAIQAEKNRVNFNSHINPPSSPIKFPPDDFKFSLPVWDGLPDDWNPRKAIDRIKDSLDHWEMLSDSQAANVRELIAIYGLMLTDLLLMKNERYGNSATDPISVFAKDISTRDRMRVRMDDKVSRLMRGGSFDDNEDPRIDLAGYLLLDLVLDVIYLNDEDH